MEKHGGGAIVNTASVSGLFGDYGLAPYNAAKAAVINYTRTLALDHAVDNIRVNAICPGHFDTPMMDTVIADRETAGILDARKKVHTESNPMGRLGRPEEMATVALFLASDDSSFVTGSYVLVDGGYMAT